MSANSIPTAAALLAQGYAAATGSECDIRYLDRCSADLFLFASRNTIPTNEDDAAKFCKVQLDAEACSRACVEKCEPRVQGWSDIFLDLIKEEIKKRCSTSYRYHNESIKYAPCLNSVGSSLHACMKDTVANLDIASRLPSEQRVEGACCHYNKLHGCWRKAAESGCPKEAVEFLQNVLQLYDGYLLGDVCRLYKCDAIQYDDKPGNASLRSLLTPLLKVFAALYV
ncbi:hypothetical protein HPB52_003861 [Rhipicephalus sanguineus]|uniref:Uncharacterized protein n=1 Tax=Rhipicephalus sanguineus TaxID=34632 RepID=A0A9D4Q9J3_RHISA|nr:hypothetical protein HPB52_003861 [Rhipicephalus sanguineus]